MKIVSSFSDKNLILAWRLFRVIIWFFSVILIWNILFTNKMVVTNLVYQYFHLECTACVHLVFFLFQIYKFIVNPWFFCFWYVMKYFLQFSADVSYFDNKDRMVVVSFYIPNVLFLSMQKCNQFIHLGLDIFSCRKQLYK